VAWNGISGFDLVGPEPAAPSGAAKGDPADWEARRIEAGLPIMGRELDERTIPAEAGLVERCVSFTKGCYTGQELVARIDARGNRVARRLQGVVVPAPAGKCQIDRGADVLREDRIVGTVTSVAWSSRLDACCALAYVHRSVEAPAEVLLRSGSAGEGRAEVPGEVRSLPLLRSVS
jgi:folate-binding protein YgfZ